MLTSFVVACITHEKPLLAPGVHSLVNPVSSFSPGMKLRGCIEHRWAQAGAKLASQDSALMASIINNTSFLGAPRVAIDHFSGINVSVRVVA